MFKRTTVIAWAGILVLSGMFLMGQQGWPGDQGIQVRTVFITDAVYGADMYAGGLGGPDAICQSEAELAGLPGIYKAWISDSTSGSPADTFIKVPNVSYQGLCEWPGKDLPRHCTQVADDWDDLIGEGGLGAPIDMNAWGNEVESGTAYVWTATGADGEALVGHGGTCMDWSTADSIEITMTGIMGAADSGWTYEMMRYCDEDLRLYCVQQDTSPQDFGQ